MTEAWVFMGVVLFAGLACFAPVMPDAIRAIVAWLEDMRAALKGEYPR